MISLLLLAFGSALAQDLTLEGPLPDADEVCTLQIPELSERPHREARPAERQARIEAGGLPDQLYPRRGKIKRKVRYYDTRGELYSSSDVALALSLRGASANAYYDWQDRERDLLVAAGALGERRSRTALFTAAVLVAPLPALILAPSLFADQQPLPELVAERDRARAEAEGSFAVALCAYNGGDGAVAAAPEEK